MKVDKVSTGAVEKYGVREGQEIKKDVLKEIKKDKDFLVQEKKGKIIIKERLVE